jgi:hypothetical protein
MAKKAFVTIWPLNEAIFSLYSGEHDMQFFIVDDYKCSVFVEKSELATHAQKHVIICVACNCLLYPDYP